MIWRRRPRLIFIWVSIVISRSRSWTTATSEKKYWFSSLDLYFFPHFFTSSTNVHFHSLWTIDLVYDNHLDSTRHHLYNCFDLYNKFKTILWKLEKFLKISLWSSSFFLYSLRFFVFSIFAKLNQFCLHLFHS